MKQGLLVGTAMLIRLLSVRFGPSPLALESRLRALTDPATVDVAGTMAVFGREYDPGRDRLWVAEREGQLVGSIGIVGWVGGGTTATDPGCGPRVPQLRRLLVYPEARGSGLDRAVVGEVLGFCRGCGYESVFLWALANLGAAIRLYIEAGFERTEEKTQ